MYKEGAISRRGAVSALVAGAVVGALPSTARAGVRVPEGVPIPEPTFSGQPDEVSRNEFLIYARSLEFDWAPDASDRRRLYWEEGEKFIRGPVAEIQPAVGLMATPKALLNRGRVVARIDIAGDWPYLVLTKGRSYVWIRRNSDTDIDAALVHEDATVPVAFGKAVPIHAMPHRAHPTDQARFRPTGENDQVRSWIPCESGCCDIMMNPVRPTPR